MVSKLSKQSCPFSDGSHRLLTHQHIIRSAESSSIQFEFSAIITGTSMISQDMKLVSVSK